MMYGSFCRDLLARTIMDSVIMLYQ